VVAVVSVVLVGFCFPALRAVQAHARARQHRVRPEDPHEAEGRDRGGVDAQVRVELRTWLRRLPDDVHVTTVFVPHDQEKEAMDIAERVVVMNEGAHRAGGGPARPLRRAREPVRHGLRRRGQPAPGRLRAPARRADRPRAERADGAHAWAQLTRDEAAQLEVREGDIVFVRADRARSFAPAASPPDRPQGRVCRA
jgi:sulfate/thiosulfate transport system ATP-binding protein